MHVYEKEIVLKEVSGGSQQISQRLKEDTHLAITFANIISTHCSAQLPHSVHH